jgi:hypothetical protein
MVPDILVINSGTKEMLHAVQYNVNLYLLSDPQNIKTLNTSTNRMMKCLFNEKCGSFHAPLLYIYIQQITKKT